MKNNPKKNNNKPFDATLFKKGIAAVESNGGKHLWNKNSSATGMYQFLYNNLKTLPFMKGITREQFRDNKELQERVMDMAINGKLKDRAGYYRNATDLTNEYQTQLGDKWNFRPDEVAAVSHFLGRQGARKYFKSIATGKEYKVPGKRNLKVEDYLQKYNDSIQKKRGFDRKLEIPKPQTTDLRIQPLMDSMKEQDTTNPNQFINDYSRKITPLLPTENEFGYGGNTTSNMKNLYEDGGLLTEFNNGGSHELNPLGGIPIGMGANGKPNLVEEGETQSGEYVFSDRLIIDKATADQFNLPKGLVGKTVAEASKKINAQANETNNSIDKETTAENLERLKGVNEQLKQMQMLEQDPNMFAPGGFMSFMNKNGAGIMGGIDTAADLFSMTQGNTTEDKALSAGTGALSGLQAGASFGPWGAGIGAVVGGVAGLIGAGKAKKKRLEKDNLETAKHFNQINNMFAFGGPTDPVDPRMQVFDDIANRKYTNAQIKTLKNPFPERSTSWTRFNDIQKSFKAGRIPHGLFKTNVTTSTTPNATGVPVDLKTKRYAPGQHNGFSVSSGPMINPGISIKDAAQMSIDNNFANGGFMMPANLDFASMLKLPKTLDLEPAGIKSLSKMEIPELDNRTPSFLTPKAPKEKSKFGEGLGNKLAQGLRYAPAVMNAIQLANMEKPEAETRNKLDKRFKPDYADEAQLTNLVNEQFGGLEESIANVSNGSVGALRSNLLAAHLNKTKALSNAFMQADNINRQQNITGQQFDLRTDQFNIGQSNLEKEVNARNQGAYDTNKSRLMATLGNDLGGIGLEALRRKYPELMGLSYDSQGRLIKRKS